MEKRRKGRRRRRGGGEGGEEEAEGEEEKEGRRGELFKYCRLLKEASLHFLKGTCINHLNF